MALKIINYIKTVLFLVNLIASFFLVWCLAFIADFFKYLGFTSIDKALVNLGKNIVISALVIVCPNTKLIFTGDLEKFFNSQDDPAIVICNHQTYFDWVYIWLLADQVHKAGDLNILLKSAMKKLPFLGPNLVKAGFLLLERNWEKDSTNIDHYMADLIHNNDNKWLLIFPEGTTRHALTVPKSQAYAKKTGRPVLEHVLLPHSTGFAALVYKLYNSEKGRHANVYDLTMQFGTYNGECPSDLVFGGTFTAPGIPHIYTFTTQRYPIECHIHINVVPLEKLLNEENKNSVNEVAEHFLDESFMKKDEEMKYFVDNQCFSEDWTKEKQVITYNYITRAGKVHLVIVGLAIVQVSYYVLKWVVKGIYSLFF